MWPRQPSRHASPFLPSCHLSWTGSVISGHGKGRDGGGGWGGGGGGGRRLSVCLSGEKTSPPPFAPPVWGGYGRLRLRPQLPVQMPAVPKIKCIKTGSQSLLSDHHDNRRQARGDDTSAPILPLPWETALLDCSLSVSWAFCTSLLSFMCPLFLLSSSSSSSSLISLSGAL